MPVTAKLSRKFYETFGDDIANELVEWFNQVDATYRFEFRDLFAVHFSRFDAKLEQRVAELRAEFQQRFTSLEAKIDKDMALLEGRMLARFGAVEGRLMRWMFVFWAANVATTVAMIQLLR